MNLLQLIRNGRVVRLIPLREGVMRIGRGGTNDLVLTDDQVSKHHAVLSQEHGLLRIDDLKSTNGSFVNGTRVSGSQQLKNHDTIRFGSAVELKVRLLVPADELLPPDIEDLTAGVRHAFRADRFRIGADPDCDLPLPEAGEAEVVLLLHADGSVWLGDQDGSDRELRIDEPFEIAGHTFAVRKASTTVTAPTATPEFTQYPYSLTASLDAPGGPEATIEDPVTEQSHKVTAGNRAVLLYLLARKAVADQGLPPDEVGWMDDSAVATGIWGKTAKKLATSSYYVLIHRLRKELKKFGFDPWFIEKRPGCIRIRLNDVAIR